MGDFNFEKDIADTLALQKEFWDNEYPELSFEEKINYWLGSIHKGMRTQGETFGDEYSEFSKKTYEVWKEDEPDFDTIFIEVAKQLPDFDFLEYQNRISKKLYIKKEE